MSPVGAALADEDEDEERREEGKIKKAVAAAARPKLALWRRSVREAREERRVKGEEEEAFMERAVECLEKVGRIKGKEVGVIGRVMMLAVVDVLRQHSFMGQVRRDEF
jgi:L-fucose isomerase-like protein|eukprot:evm.model.NODE_45513_length_12246_cov_26.632124.1